MEDEMEKSKASKRPDNAIQKEVPAGACLIATGFRRGAFELMICSRSEKTTSAILAAELVGNRRAPCGECEADHEVVDVLTAFRTQRVEFTDNAALLSIGDVLALALQDSVYSTEGPIGGSKLQRRKA